MAGEPTGRRRRRELWPAAIGGAVGLGLAVAIIHWQSDAPAPPPQASVAVPQPQAAAQPKPVAPALPPLPPQQAAISPPVAPAPQPAAPVVALAPPVPAKAAGEPPWRRFAAVAPDSAGKPMIAIVIDDLGPDRARTARTIALPAPLTLSFLPYAEGVSEQVDKARAAGHEVLVHLPMAPENRSLDPGRNALYPDLPRAEIERRIAWNLDRFGGYVGVNNHMGSRFMADAPGVALVLDAVKARGLLFLDSRTGAHSPAAEIAARLKIPFLERQVFLDPEPGAAVVAQEISSLESVARKHGRAIAIGHPKDATLDKLKAWTADAASRGFVLVPLSAIASHAGGW